MNVLQERPSFGELLFHYNRHRKYSDDELADKISVSVRDIIIPKNKKCPNVINDEITVLEDKNNTIIEIKSGNTVIKEPSDIIDLWFNNELYTLRGKYVSRLIRLFKLTDEQSTEFLFASGCQQSFGKLLEFYMWEKKFNNTKLAKKVGVAVKTVGCWIKDGIMPRPESVREIAKVLDILKLPDRQIIEFYLLAGVAPPSGIGGEIIGIDDKVKDTSVIDEASHELAYPTLGIPISHPNQFFGRLDILRRFKRAWQNPNALQHIAIIGKRRSGKTSLLKYLQYIAQTPTTELRSEQHQIWNGWLPKDFQFVLIDFQYAAMSQPESLLTHILNKLNLPVPNPCNLIEFTQVLDEQLTRPTIMLFDEIGAGLQSPDLDQTFWSNMRALGNHCADGKLGFVVTAHEQIHILTKDNSKESPFFNIFGHNVHLKPLTTTEATDLINSFFKSLPTIDIDWLLRNSGGWPALLQLLCDSRLHALDTNDDSDTWKTEGKERIKPFLIDLPTG
ncbi:helix-turn-helix transcriptional regulator [Candidatus Halobeggiatoa sp. HSG11]|nr:helix-turn-helix transcriptional regulator [Candidatus Halobeggiatoa sp. HSG11]